MLFLDREPHVLQHGERIGERDRAPDLEELEAQQLLPGFERTVEAHLDAAVVFDAFHLLDVEHRDPRGVGLAVVGAEGFAVAPEQAGAVLLAEVVEQGVVEIVGPRPAHRAHPLLQLGDVVARGVLRIDPDDDVEPGQHRLRQVYGQLECPRRRRSARGSPG